MKLAGGAKNIEFVPLIKDAEELSDLVGRAKAFVFPSLEPFGIAPIEALSAGTPVIAFNQGGSLDYIKDGQNGVFFDSQTVEGVIKGIKKFNKLKLNAEKISATAKKFDETQFKQEFERLLKEKISGEN